MTFYLFFNFTKCLRSCLERHGVLFDHLGRSIKWSHVEALEALQSKEGLRLANKVTKRHIKYQQQKMSVRLAVQVISSSVASGIEFCAKELQLQDFQVSFFSQFPQLFEQIMFLLAAGTAQLIDRSVLLFEQNDQIFVGQFLISFSRCYCSPATH